MLGMKKGGNRLPMQGYYVDADGNCAACTLTGCAKCASPGGDVCEECSKVRCFVLCGRWA